MLLHWAFAKLFSEKRRSSPGCNPGRDFPFFFWLLFFFRKKKNPADVTPLGFCQAFLRKASIKPRM
jgi:hypothetical protein